MKKFLLLLFVLFSVGCSSEFRDLNDVEESALIDYLSWLDERHDDVMTEAKDRGLNDDLSDLLTQSIESDYYVYTGKPDAIAVARLAKDEVVLHIQNDFWDSVLGNYYKNRDAWDECKNTNHLYQARMVSMVLCHENAHLIGARPHDDVYEVGYICSDLWNVDLVEWENDCKI